jgi:uncharacterized membrane protein
MIRLTLWAIGGLLLGGIIHLVAILILPALAEDDAWTRVAALETIERFSVLERPVPGAPNPFGLDPSFIQAVCQLNIADGPGALEGVLPDSFWSLAVYEPDGSVIYSTTERSASDNFLNVGIFNPDQTRLLAQQAIEIDEGLLIVEAVGNDVAAVVRLWLEYDELASRYKQALAGLTCRVVR